MRRAWRTSFCIAVWLVACASLPTGTEPPRQFAVMHSEVMKDWWASVEACSGHVGDFSRMHLYVRMVADGTGVLGDKPDSNGEVIAGYTAGNTIIVGLPWAMNGAIWRHEMGHALDPAHSGYHPPELFQRACRGVVDCNDACIRDSLPHVKHVPPASR